MSTPKMISGKRASFLELFFDLVFVFAVTQVAALLREDVSFAGFAKGMLLLTFLWWTWSVYTWTTNWTGTEQLSIRLAILGAMGASMLMAQAVPDAFEDGGAWFATAYFAVRLLAAAIYWVGARNHEAQRAALTTFLPLSLSAAVLVLIGGYFDGEIRGAVWVAALVIDLVSAANSSKATWEIDAAHFAERNGLFIIIALGESIVAIGVGASGAERDASLVFTLLLAFAGAAAMWWSYFDRAQLAGERYLAAASPKERGMFARDAYSILHFPIVAGIVLYAVAVEEVVAHPDEHLVAGFRFALAAGMSMVLLAMVAANYRATRRIPVERLVAAAALIVVAVVSADLRGDVLTAGVVTIVVAGLWWERARAKIWQPA